MNADTIKPNNQSRLLRWGFTWFVAGFLLLLSDLFHLSGTVWEALIFIVFMIIAPEYTAKGRWPRRILSLLGTLVFFIALMFLAMWVNKQTGIRAMVFLALVALLAGIICQGLGGIFQAADARQASGLGRALVEKIRGL